MRQVIYGSEFYIFGFYIFLYEVAGMPRFTVREIKQGEIEVDEFGSVALPSLWVVIDTKRGQVVGTYYYFEQEAQNAADKLEKKHAPKGPSFS